MHRLRCHLSIALGFSLAGSGLALVPDTLLQSLPQPTAAGPHFGQSIAAEGDYVVVGAPHSKGDTNVAVRVFDSKTGALKVTIPNPGYASDEFGSAVAISGTEVLVGAPYGSDAVRAPNLGTVYLYNVALGSSVPAGQFGNPDLPFFGGPSLLGSVVAVSGPRVVLMADAARAYMYGLENAVPPWAVPYAGGGFTRAIGLAGDRLVLADANGSKAYIYDLASSSPSVPVATLVNPEPGAPFGLHIAASGSRVLLATNRKAFIYRLDTPQATTPEQTLEVPGGSNLSSAAISGQRVSLGVLDDRTVHIYDLGSGNPQAPISQVGTPDPNSKDGFGYAVAIAGDTLAVGVPFDDAAGVNTGSVFLYPLSPGSAALEPKKIVPSNLPSPTAINAGWAVAVSGRRMVVGTYGGEMAVVYDLGGGTPMVPIATLDPPNIGAQAQFGWSVAISGQLVVVGSPLNGQAYVYDLAGSVPEMPVATLVGGYAAAMSGTQVALANRDGKVRVYGLTEHGIPIGVTTITGPVANSTSFGYSLDISGSRVVVGTGVYTAEGSESAERRYAYVYDLASATPTLPAATLLNPNPAPGDQFGFSVAISGTLVAVGARSENTGAFSAGSVYLYDLNAAAPALPVFTIHHPNPSNNADFGNSVSLSGRQLVVGSWLHASSPETIYSGAAYLYDLDATPTVPAATLVCPNPEFGRRFGYSVAIDDKIVAVGGPGGSNVLHGAYAYGRAAPDMVVEAAPRLTSVEIGASQSLGNVMAGNWSSVTFTIRNIGPVVLNGVAATVTGANAAEFVLMGEPAAEVAGLGESTSFSVRFAPQTTGSKAAVLRIASNDPDESVFEINLVGTGLASVSQVVGQGAPATLSANIPGAMALQWRKDGVEIPGGVGPTLIIPSVQPWHIGVYSVRATTTAGIITTDVALLGITGLMAEVWRGLVAWYPFDTNLQDLSRPGKPAALVSTSELVTNPRRGGVAHVQGKGWGIPPLGEPPEFQGPGGYIRIPRPPVGNGDPFTVSFIIEEEGFTLWHGESFLTMGEGAASIDLISHSWIGNFSGTQENYGGHNVGVEPVTSTFALDGSGSGVILDIPWTTYTVVAEGDSMRLYRNGQLMGATPYKKDTAGDFFIGRHWWENGTRYSTRLIAKVDDLRVFNRAFSAAEVQQLYTQVQTTPTAGTFESWALVHGLTGADAAPDGDSDRDGRTSWEEFAFGTSPSEGADASVKAVVVGSALTLTWLERDGIVYSLKETADFLAPWATSATVASLAGDQSGVPAGYWRMQVEIAVPPPGPGSPRYFRVEASKIR